MRLLVVGICTRALAQSARRAGFSETVGLDYFGDRDQRLGGETYALASDFDLPPSPEHLAQAARRLRYDAVAYSSSLENHPLLVAALAAGARGDGRHPLWGNSPTTLARVRHVPSLMRVCRRTGVPWPATLLHTMPPSMTTSLGTASLPPEQPAGPSGPVAHHGGRRGHPPTASDAPEAEPDERERWLRKPRAAGGGRGVHDWALAEGAPSKRAGTLLQRYVTGRPFSASFVANGRAATLLGLSEGLAGLPECGTAGYTYCGSMVPPRGDRERWLRLLPRLRDVANALTRAFGLLGLNGIDLIEGPTGDDFTLLEVNPRYSGSMELIERIYDVPLFAWHAAAITTGELPRFDLECALHQGTSTLDKAIVYAREMSVVPDTDSWLSADVADVPYSGSVAPAGAPVCTVFQQGTGQIDDEMRLAGLMARARWITMQLSVASTGSNMA